MFVKTSFPAPVAVPGKLVIFGLGIQFNSPPVPAPEPERSTPSLGNSCSLPCRLVASVAKPLTKKSVDIDIQNKTTQVNKLK